MRFLSPVTQNDWMKKHGFGINVVKYLTMKYLSTGKLGFKDNSMPYHGSQTNTAAFSDELAENA